MKVSRRKFFIQSIGGLIAAGLFDSWFLERYFIDFQEEFVYVSSTDSAYFRVVQVSDIHFQSLNWGLKKAIDKINRLKPDIILFTGDSVDNHAKVEDFANFLNLLERDIPKFAVLGNWEYWGKVNLHRLKEIYAANNCRLLVNETAQIQIKSSTNYLSKTFAITGVDDFVGGTADYLSAIQNYQPSDFHIVLTHCPQYHDVIASTSRDNPKIDLVLAGHTHGGQLNLFGYVPFLPQGSGRYLKGWYKDQMPILYVSKGVGTSILPFRFMARAEIPVFLIGF